MKQKDLATIGAAVVFSIVVSFIISNKVISTPQNRSRKVEQVSVISPIFAQPNAKYFNSQSIDPTQLIQISNNSNGTPFNGTSSQ